VRSSSVLAIVQRSFQMWSSRGISVPTPTVDKSVRCQDLRQAHVKARKACFVTDGSISVLTAANECVIDRQIALPVHVRQSSLGVPSGLGVTARLRQQSGAHMDHALGHHGATSALDHQMVQQVSRCV